MDTDITDKAKEYEKTIRKLKRPGLLKLWKGILSKNTPAWPAGKAFEYLVIRAFEIEGADVRYPYPVSFHKTFGTDNNPIEQIDGAIHIERFGLSILVESKNEENAISIEPIAKLRNQLLRRSSHAVGSIFSISGFTQPAMMSSQFISPQTILLWEKIDIQHSLINGQFISTTVQKYQRAIEEGITHYTVAPLPIS